MSFGTNCVGDCSLIGSRSLGVLTTGNVYGYISPKTNYFIQIGITPLFNNLQMRFYRVSVLPGAEETPVTFEGVPETLMDRLIVFLTAERAKLREAAVGRVAGYEGAAAQQWPAGTTFLGHQADENAARDERRGTGPAAVVLTSVGGSKGDFQRKVSHHERAALLADVLDELEAAGEIVRHMMDPDCVGYVQPTPETGCIETSLTLWLRLVCRHIWFAAALAACSCGAAIKEHPS